MTSKAGRSLYRKLETGFTTVFIIFVSILTLSIFVYVSDMYSYSGLNEVLASSLRTPWGIMTSLLVHADEAHLLNNMIALFLFLMLLLVSNAFLSEEDIKRRISESLLVMLAVPVVLNLLLIFIFPDVKMIGSSGIVYVLQGRCLGFSLLNTLELRRSGNCSQDERNRLLVSSLSNLAIFAGFLASFILSPSVVLGSKHEAINWFHGSALVGGFSTALFHVVRQRLKGKIYH